MLRDRLHGDFNRWTLTETTYQRRVAPTPPQLPVLKALPDCLSDEAGIIAEQAGTGAKGGLR